MKVAFAVLLLVGVALANPAAYPKVFPERIVGGQPAVKGAFPYICQIKRNGGQYCGASLVTPNCIVTAAHCAQASLAGYTIVAGEHNLTQNEGTEQSRTVSKIIVHPNYNSQTLNSDVAVMKLSSPVTVGEFVKPANLSREIPTGNVQVAGWGTTAEGGSLPSILMKVAVPMVDLATCRADYGSGQILAGMICAGEGGKDSCQGDSGGPLVNSAGELCGIVSWGYGCARPGYPGVYTDQSYFRDWIQEHCTA